MEPVDLFYSYAHEDNALRDELSGHLKIMERRGVIRPWHDRCLTPGEKWDGKIHESLQAADLVLLLISSDFISSDYIWSQELDVAMKRHERGEASVIPVLLRAVDIAGAPFEKLQGLPTDFRPVTSWPNRDEAWTDVAKGIRKTVEHIQTKRPELPPLPPAAVPTMPAPIPAPSRDVVPEAERNPDQTVKAVSITGSRGAQADVLFGRVVREFSDRIVEAGKARGMDAIDQAQTERYASLLIDVPDQKRVLWVDDRPSNNRMETAALSKLQIEVVPVIGTKEALGRLESDPEPFDLVLSDWVRPELHLDTLSAGIHLLRQLRKRQIPVPVVFYHSTSSEQERDQRREQALREGAFGEAVMPDELLGLVTKTLALQ
ncbi:MAG: response regulator receiver protein [Nitrospira sp. UW-LDO-01]|nr:TIR domain-containing protein [Nitrospira sp.]MBL8052657.1 TIR domain-containing protein [Nitrospira sp.]OYT20988.1 MAG: response regulator receiver protein [Nitrospira sp. UW-LDO-01]